MVSTAYPLLSWSQLSQLCPLPTSPAAQVYLLTGQCEGAATTSSLYVSNHRKQPCVISTVVAVNPKHSTPQSYCEENQLHPAKLSRGKQLFISSFSS